MRFEPAGTRWFSLLSLVAAVGVLATVSFFTMDVAFTRLFGGTETEQLVRENKAMANSIGPLSDQVAELRQEIEQLEETEAAIYQKIYLKGRTDEVTASPVPKPDDLKSSDFAPLAEDTRQKASLAGLEASRTNQWFSTLFWPGKEDVTELESIPTLAPVKEFSVGLLAAGFGKQINPFNKMVYRHLGLDIVGEPGSEVLAAGSGQVVSVERNSTPGGSGVQVVISHSLGYRSRYTHLEEVIVRPGQRVKRGDPIARIGVSGSSIAPHLHFEISRNGNPVNPAIFMAASLNPAEYDAVLRESTLTKKALD